MVSSSTELDFTFNFSFLSKFLVIVFSENMLLGPKRVSGNWLLGPKRVIKKLLLGPKRVSENMLLGTRSKTWQWKDVTRSFFDWVTNFHWQDLDRVTSFHWHVLDRLQSNIFSLTCFGPSNNFPLTRFGPSNMFSLTTITRNLDKKLKLKLCRAWDDIFCDPEPLPYDICQDSPSWDNPFKGLICKYQLHYNPW